MTITKGNGPTYHVLCNQPHLIDQDLDAAVELAVKQSIESGAKHGILVTRFGPSSFTVAVSAEVPYGMTHEREHQGGRPGMSGALQPDMPDAA